MKTKIVTLIGCFMLTLGTVGCADKSVPDTQNDTEAQNQADTLNDIANAETLLVATDASYPPFEFKDEMGAVIGFDADLLNAVAHSQGFNVKFIHQPWSQLFTSLDQDTRDIVASSVWITDERKQTMDMSKPYFTSDVVLIGLEGNDLPKTLDEIKEKTIVLQGGGSANEGVYADVLANSNNKQVLTKTSYLAFKDLLAGKADYVLDTEGLLRYYMKNAQNKQFFVIHDERFPTWQWGYAVKKGNTALLNKLNAGIDAVKTSGDYQKINDKWFGETITN